MRRDITGTKQCSVVIHTALFYAVEQQLDAGGAWVVKRMVNGPRYGDRAGSMSRVRRLPASYLLM